jgi:hypothetical protein
MSVDGLVQKIGETADRKGFLRKVGVASLGAVGFSVFAPAKAEAYSFACCVLCTAPSSTCKSSSACSWCWICCTNSNAMFRCCEGYPAGVGCNGGCASACSYVEALGCCVC